MSTTSAQLAETAKIARVLLGWCDPREVNDPEVFTAGIIAVLSAYPLNVQQTVADPRAAIIMRVKDHERGRGFWRCFTEIVQLACEDVYGPIRRNMEREKRTTEQLAERKRLEEDRTARPTLDELKAKYGQNWGLTVYPDQSPDEQGRLDGMARFSQQSIEQEWAALGKEPLTVNGMLVSPALAKQLRGTL